MGLIIDLIQNGLAIPDVGLAANRVALGAFFAISGYHKLFNAKRHETVRETLERCGVPFVAFNCWFVPAVEFAGGIALLSGVLAPLAAAGLFVICLVATLTDGLDRVPAMRPIDKADYLDDVLYLPEVLYLLGLLIVITSGPGGWTLI
jgi:putative oxidoreductase